jgi:nucleoside-diphosphate-sugar epimerase
MPSSIDQRPVLITGAGGHIGTVARRLLKDGSHRAVAVDLNSGLANDVLKCDLTSKHEIARIFEAYPIRAVIHLAGVLPTAFQSDPLAGAELNLVGSLELIRQAVAAGVERFVFASSMSVYGSSPSSRPFTEIDPPAPDEPYGASKRAIELVGETLTKKGTIEFVSLRIARVVGPGIRKTASPWRSQIFEPYSSGPPIEIPFAPMARLSLVHVEEVARMLIRVTDIPKIESSIYNTPVETWEAAALKHTVEEILARRVELTSDADGGPICDGSRFARDFEFQLKGARNYLLGVAGSLGSPTIRRVPVKNDPIDLGSA